MTYDPGSGAIVPATAADARAAVAYLRTPLAIRVRAANVLEGGTWAAGRQLARERRPGGGSPIPVDSDGTVF